MQLRNSIMSQSKAVSIRGQLVFALDNSHDIVVAHLVEAVDRTGCPSWLTPALAEWRVNASVADLAFDFADHWNTDKVNYIADRLQDVRQAIARHGDMTRQDLQNWSVLDGACVSDGYLRYDVLPVEALLDTVDAFLEMFTDTLPPIDEDQRWFVGVPGGRQTLAIRQPSSQ
jgi:hypothetical protein